jgi:phosphinothricin acetyltransferase
VSSRIRPVARGDWRPITTIFNLYVAESFAAYPDQPVGESFFRARHEAHPEYPFVVAVADDAVAGFAYLSPFHPVPTMRRSAVLTYFLHPDHTGQGLGTAFLEHLIETGRGLGIDNFLAHVSSLNPGSIRFHLKHGFTECGRFQAVGAKNGRPFDMVWLQRLVA